MRMLILGAAIATLSTAALTTTVAAREPTADERTRIEQTLRSNGFVSWDDIELDENVWEVDDAMRTANSEGRRESCDLELSPASYEIIKRDCD
jgi:hypothetical protein